jgi:hypothetical protein
MKRPARVPSQLSESMHKRLNAYTLAASAAGVGMFALAQPVEARVIYTKAHILIHNRSYPLDLNHDGLTDFTLSAQSGVTAYSRFSAGLGVRPPADHGPNQIWHFTYQHRTSYAAALKGGVRIGPKARFGPGNFWVMASANSNKSYSKSQWCDVRNRYLGMRFVIGRKTHYGWARMNATCDRDWSLLLTGYAYETIPNKPIIAGKTRGPDVITEQPATLGHLAAGVSAISAWRTDGNP